jgi:hypothetical protein
MRFLNGQGGAKINEEYPKSLKTEGKIRIFSIGLGQKVLMYTHMV